MGVSTNGQICYGFLLTEQSVPWDLEEYDHEFEFWWLKITGFDTPHEDYSAEWFEARKEHIERTQMPDLVNACSNDYPLYILALRGTTSIARRGYPSRIAPFPEISRGAIEHLRKVISDHNLELEEPEPGWWLSSYWG